MNPGPATMAVVYAFVAANLVALACIDVLACAASAVRGRR